MWLRENVSRLLAHSPSTKICWKATKSVTLFPDKDLTRKSMTISAFLSCIPEGQGFLWFGQLLPVRSLRVKLHGRTRSQQWWQRSKGGPPFRGLVGEQGFAHTWPLDPCSRPGVCGGVSYCTARLCRWCYSLLVSSFVGTSGSEFSGPFPLWSSPSILGSYLQLSQDCKSRWNPTMCPDAHITSMFFFLLGMRVQA